MKCTDRTLVESPAPSTWTFYYGTGQRQNLFWWPVDNFMVLYWSDFRNLSHPRERDKILHKSESTWNPNSSTKAQIFLCLQAGIETLHHTVPSVASGTKPTLGGVPVATANSSRRLRNDHLSHSLTTPGINGLAHHRTESSPYYCNVGGLRRRLLQLAN